MLVDDEAPIRRFAATALVRAGFEVVEASSGQRALALFRRDPTAYDLAVIDLAMPGVSGVEVARAFKHERPDLPVVLMSGNFDLAHETLRELDVRELPKPFRKDRLLHCVRDALDERD